MQRHFTPRVLFALTTLVILIGAVSMGMGRHGGFGEASVATAYSIALLGATGWVCLRLGLMRPAAQGARLFWSVVSAAFVFLALDEAFEIHEQLDHNIHARLGLAETALSDRIDDLIVLLYGLLGAGFLLMSRDSLQKAGVMVPYLVAGFVLFLISVGCDLLTNRSEYLDFLALTGDARTYVGHGFVVLEEGAKLLAETCLLVAFAAGLMGADQPA